MPRQLPLVEVDDHLGIAGAGFTGGQQGHVFGVLPVGRSMQDIIPLLQAVKLKYFIKKEYHGHHLFF